MFSFYKKSIMKNLFILFMLIPTFVFSQGWEKTYGSGYGYSVKQTTDGGYVITGATGSILSGYVDIFLLKTNGNGDTLWTKTYGGNYYDFGYSVQETDDGYIITGYTSLNSTGNNDVYLLKTNGKGDTLWTKTYGGNADDEGHSVQQTTDGGYIITGATSSFGNDNDIYLIKTNGNGDTLWTKTYGGSYGDDFGNSVQQTTDGGYIITGFIYSISTLQDVCLIKTDSSGNTLWTKTYGGNYNDIGYSVQQTTDGGYIVTGYKSVNDVYLIKTDSSGDTLWTKTFGGNLPDGGRSVQQTTDGGYIITGYSYSVSNSNGDHDVYLIKTNGIGDTLWTKTFGGQYNDFGFSVKQTTDGGYIITGVTSSDGNNNIVYLIKIDGNGSTVIKEIPIPNNNIKLIKIVDLLGKEIIYPKKNIPYIEIYDDGSSRKRIILE